MNRDHPEPNVDTPEWVAWRLEQGGLSADASALEAAFRLRTAEAIYEADSTPEGREKAFNELYRGFARCVSCRAPLALNATSCTRCGIAVGRIPKPKQSGPAGAGTFGGSFGLGVLLTLLAVGAVAGAFFVGRSGGSAPAYDSAKAPAPPTACGLADVNLAARGTVRVENAFGTGSGFLITDDLVVTAKHVISGTSTERIQLADGTRIDARVVHTSDLLDIAVMQLSRPFGGLALSWGDSAGLQGAQTVVAIGFPLSATGPPILTRGSVSRSYTSSKGTAYVQTDAAVNEGNSGGPLVDDCGHIVGVIVLKLQDAEGIGWALASNQVKAEVAKLVSSPPVSISPASTPIAPTPVAPTTRGGAPSTGEVTSISSNFARVTSFKATIVQTGGSVENVQGSIEYVQPDRIHVIVGRGATAQEIICIGNDFYVKAGSAAWQKVPSAQASSTNCHGNLGPADPQALAKGINSAVADRTLNKGGQDIVSGQRCQVYSQVLPNGASFEMCVVDGLPVRIVSKADQKSVTILFSDFNRSIDIKAPT